MGNPKVSHILPKLLEYIKEIGIEINEEAMSYVIRLNMLYIPTRYPDAWPEGIPEEFYTREEAEEAIHMAETVLDEVDKIWRRLLKRGYEKERK